jgi:hypothetical protein
MAITLLAKIANLTTVGKSLFNTNITKVGEIAIDCSHSEIIEYANVVTMHPVQDGSFVSDHIYKKPVKIKLQGSIVDASTSVFGAVRNVANVFNGNILNNIQSAFSSKGRNQLTAYEALKDFATNKPVVDLVMYWDSFENMAIESITMPRDGKTGERLYFEMTLVNVVYAGVEFSNISNKSRSTQDLLSSKTNLGKKQTLPPTVEQKRAASTAANAWKGIKNFFGG